MAHESCLPTSLDLWALAYHEAGHAVACCARDVHFEKVTVIANDVPGGDGGVGLGWELQGGATLRAMEPRHVDGLIVALCAGPIAEARYRGLDPIDFLHRREPELAGSSLRARAWLGLDNDWDRAVLTCEELSRVYGTPVVDVIRHVVGLVPEARSLASERWRDIEIVAVALHERQMLTADEIHVIL